MPPCPSLSAERWERRKKVGMNPAFQGKQVPEDSTVARKRTCLDCGFLTIRGRELTQPERVMLGTKGQSAVMPANADQTRCFKNLWDYDLTYVGDNFGGVVEEIERERHQCRGFAPYEAGFTPEQHLEHQIDQRKEKLQWRIAKLSFFGALLGGVIGIMILEVLKWLQVIK